MRVARALSSTRGPRHRRVMTGASRAAAESALRELWATSRDGWIDVPGEARGTIFWKPLDGSTREAKEGGRSTPEVVKRLRLFAVTGHNPMGRRASVGVNARANARLEADLAADDACGTRWRSFGFDGEGWREDGFVVGFEDADVGRAKMVALAIRYEQGAIYEYEAEGETRVRRRTVPAAMSDAVEAEAVLVMCDPPPGYVGTMCDPPPGYVG